MRTKLMLEIFNAKFKTIHSASDGTSLCAVIALDNDENIMKWKSKRIYWRKIDIAVYSIYRKPRKYSRNTVTSVYVVSSAWSFLLQFDGTWRCDGVSWLLSLRSIQVSSWLRTWFKHNMMGPGPIAAIWTDSNVTMCRRNNWVVSNLKWLISIWPYRHGTRVNSARMFRESPNANVSLHSSHCKN